MVFDIIMALTLALTMFLPVIFFILNRFKLKQRLQKLRISKEALTLIIFIGTTYIASATYFIAEDIFVILNNIQENRELGFKSANIKFLSNIIFFSSAIVLSTMVTLGASMFLSKKVKWK